MAALSRFVADDLTAVEATLNKLSEAPPDRISQAALDFLRGYLWPGNVRELANVMERMVVLKGEGEITSADLPLKILLESVLKRLLPR